MTQLSPAHHGPMSNPVRLADHTTLRLGGPADSFVVAQTQAELIAAVTEADRAGQDLLLLAGGSNVVVADAGVRSTVVKIATTGITVANAQEDILVTIAAGEPFDRVVAQFTAQGWSGIEFLSGIPGSAAATPIQNVGAYGAEISQVLESVDVLLRRPGGDAEPVIRTLKAADLQLGYRSSVLRGSDQAVVLSITIRLTRRPNAIRFGELTRVLGVAAGDSAPPQQVRAAVLDLRRAKGMVLDENDQDTWSAGSFFTNPVLELDQAGQVDQAIQRRLGSPDYPRYPGVAKSGAEGVKLSAAWLIERAGFAKGFSLPDRPGARLSTKHTLALTNRGGTTEDLIYLARHIRDGVAGEFGVRLEPEPILIGVAL